jgi:hypothetical protein
MQDRGRGEGPRKLPRNKAADPADTSGPHRPGSEPVATEPGEDREQHRRSPRGSKLE